MTKLAKALLNSNFDTMILSHTQTGLSDDSFFFSSFSLLANKKRAPRGVNKPNASTKKMLNLCAKKKNLQCFIHGLCLLDFPIYTPTVVATESCRTHTLSPSPFSQNNGMLEREREKERIQTHPDEPLEGEGLSEQSGLHAPTGEPH